MLALLVGAAVLHAGWNILLKTAQDPLRTAGRGMLVGAGVLVPAGIVGWLAVGRPPIPTETWLLGLVSGLLEAVYFALLSGAYARGDLSLVYPIARGTAPVLSVFVGIVFLGERLGPIGALGVALLLAGILSLQRPWAVLGRSNALPRRAREAAWLAVATGISIACYSAVDRVGARSALAGEWKGALSVDARPPHPLPLSFENWPSMPAVLYQGMIAPIAPLSLTGAIWYQGEANSDRAYQYRKLLPAMIADWRKLFAQGDFPFYIVSLPAFMHHQNEPVEAAWAELREAQALTAHSVRNSGLAVAIDTGDPDNIHPADKKVVGERLALNALAQYYGEKIPYQGPTFKSFERAGGELKLHFANIEGGLVVKGEKLGEFSVAGNDHRWYWAEARIEGDAVIVSSPQVAAPVAARYAWQSYPIATLFNGAGLPAVPFRTDDWPALTAK
ncbi:MAG TPA: EamA family transporter [Patescibacteria group bacterium]|nr:EamA family transporter [Patescibacteria group bacterium]